MVCFLLSLSLYLFIVNLSVFVLVANLSSVFLCVVACIVLLRVDRSPHLFVHCVIFVLVVWKGEKAMANNTTTQHTTQHDTTVTVAVRVKVRVGFRVRVKG
jgi:hypothetical protein